MLLTPAAGLAESPPAPLTHPPLLASSPSPDVNMLDVHVSGSGRQKESPPGIADPPTPIVSFKEKLLTNQGIQDVAAAEDFVLEEGDIKTFATPEGPVVQISDRYRKYLHGNWENSLIIKLWGRNIGYRTLYNRLPTLWKLQGAVKVIDLDHNFYIVRFHNKLDRLRVLTDGPWMLFGHYLTVEPWRPQFDPAGHKVTSVVAWVQLPGLSCEYYDRPLLKAVCDEIGQMVRVDYNTQESVRGKFARVAIELDLLKPLQSKVCVDGRWYFISYENLPGICFECGHVGHNMAVCPNRVASLSSAPVATTTSNESHPDTPPTLTAAGPLPESTSATTPQQSQKFGPWMVVQSRQRRPPRQSGDANTKKEIGQGKKSGSRFDVLNDYETVDRPLEKLRGKEVKSKPQSVPQANGTMGASGSGKDSMTVVPISAPAHQGPKTRDPSPKKATPDLHIKQGKPVTLEDGPSGQGTLQPTQITRPTRPTSVVSMLVPSLRPNTNQKLGLVTNAENPKATRTYQPSIFGNCWNYSPGGRTHGDRQYTGGTGGQNHSYLGFAATCY
ncbi:hypothetical protein Tsubulata_036068 [Turnera subulata]|uniref:CCHC-type domain-containing protein n=1 Tax=Turnera subulata TaxID=218843 RepID=A0A9Q0J718_9ROSI|nr:hypothetical protein Tsubulata_036068 [Turnera subulata]